MKMRPTDEWTLEQWKTWVHDNRDIRESTVVLDADLVLRIVKGRQDASDQIARVWKAWDEERQRL